MQGKNDGKKANWSLKQAHPGSTYHAVTTQPLPPSLLTALSLWFINGFLSQYIVGIES